MFYKPRIFSLEKRLTEIKEEEEESGDNLPIMPLVPGYPCSVPGYLWCVPASP